MGSWVVETLSPYAHTMAPLSSSVISAALCVRQRQFLWVRVCVRVCVCVCVRACSRRWPVMLSFLCVCMCGHVSSCVCQKEYFVAAHSMSFTRCTYMINIMIQTCVNPDIGEKAHDPLYWQGRHAYYDRIIHRNRCSQGQRVHHPLHSQRYTYDTAPGEDHTENIWILRSLQNSC